jgi:hypothetical protein
MLISFPLPSMAASHWYLKTKAAGLPTLFGSFVFHIWIVETEHDT